MRLAKNEVSPSLPYPFHPTASRRGTLTEVPPVDRQSDPVTARSTAERREVADLMDLVADRRPDLLNGFLEVLGDSDATREHAASLIELVAACGVAESRSPCATATAISVHLEKLVDAAGRWTHPAQIVRWPNVPALARLCAARLEKETGPARGSLEKILPHLERAARLTEKAAARRTQGAARKSK